MAQISQMVTEVDYPEGPLTLFQKLLQSASGELVLMDVATVDNEFGVLNRTMVYRGLLDGDVVFATDRSSRKYQNLKENPKLSVSFYFPEVPAVSKGDGNSSESWQVRLMDAEAVELNEQLISKYWAEESVYGKIRGHICESGKAGNRVQLQQQHDELLREYQDGSNQLEQTKTYTVFKVRTNCWDFYNSGENVIGDRVQYRKRKCSAGDAEGQWQLCHVVP